MKWLSLISAACLLNACVTSSQSTFETPAAPDVWTQDAAIVDAVDLRQWWHAFNEPVLNQLIDMALADNPDINNAQARIAQARGLRQTRYATLLPSLGLSASAGRQETVSTSADNFYEAGFDAAYEVDLFGKNRNAIDAVDADITALRADLQAARLSLVAEIVRVFIDYREANKNLSIAQKNLKIQSGTLHIVRQRYQYGEGTRLDVERAESQVHNTRASLPEYQRLSDNAALSLIGLTGALPDHITAILQQGRTIPVSALGPVLMAPAAVLNGRPDVRAAQARLVASQAQTASVTASLFPTLTLSGFFGVAESSVSSATTIWSLAAGTAVSLIDFGRIEGQIDSAKAQEMQAYQEWRKAVLQTVQDVETAMRDYIALTRRYDALTAAYDNTAQALFLSQDLFQAGEVSFIDVLDAQRNLNQADGLLVIAEAAKAQTLIRLYKALGVL